ncbi:hypothetical protein HPT29_007755 [Microvirga terrae]|uniref:Lipoprotein n=1 Tax=Microvirga terrae TaxID=2740529 RepID=A0ABY5RVH7_9HYPH|nr:MULTISPECIES: hypothetical protein [Microvirga]MBQ0823368.1 hypothetical protein [Microvirga sp. HBU67558]UVF21008.1 hypothetical protein HPT29_007755 [Microvirga terrae]
MRTVTHALSLTGLLALAACNQTASAPAPASASLTPSSSHMPQGSGCSGEIDRYRAVMSNDLAMGHVNQSVYNQVDRELRQAESACVGGRDAEAVRLVRATKSRHGYL